jgi:hypothetical protein
MLRSSSEHPADDQRLASVVSEKAAGRWITKIDELVTNYGILPAARLPAWCPAAVSFRTTCEPTSLVPLKTVSFINFICPITGASNQEELAHIEYAPLLVTAQSSVLPSRSAATTKERRQPTDLLSIRLITGHVRGAGV